jgi:hypothetical protein
MQQSLSVQTCNPTTRDSSTQDLFHSDSQQYPNIPHTAVSTDSSMHPGVFVGLQHGPLMTKGTGGLVGNSVTLGMGGSGAGLGTTTTDVFVVVPYMKSWYPKCKTIMVMPAPTSMTHVTIVANAIIHPSPHVKFRVLSFSSTSLGLLFLSSKESSLDFDLFLILE